MMSEERYRVSEDFRTAIPGWESVTNYQEHIEMLKDILVPEDRKEFLLATKPETVLKKVKDGNPYYIEFCTGTGDEKHWYQAKVIHHSAHVNKNCVIVSIKKLIYRYGMSDYINTEIHSHRLSNINKIALNKK